MRRLQQTQTQALQGLVEQYRRQNGVSAVNLREVAAWAVRNGLWEVGRSSSVNILSRALANALREEYFRDPQGRRVRKKHAQRIVNEIVDGRHEQLVFWHDITEASRPEMQAAFQQRRRGIVMDCNQLKQDVDSYNENYNSSVPIQMVFDFTEDLKDIEHENVEEEGDY